MTSCDVIIIYDVIIIGAGAAGSTCAEILNKAGRRVALVEREALGGTCLNAGCDPTKTALHVAKLLHEARQSRLAGLDIAGPPPGDAWRWLHGRIRGVQNEMRGGTEVEARRLMRQRGIDLIIGPAEFVSPHEVVVDGRLLSAGHFLIATGTAPAVPDIPGLDGSGYLTNETIFDLPAPPERLVIMGAGPVGVEFAQLFARFGSRVHLVEMADHILPKDDPELAATLADVLRGEGIDIRARNRVTAVALQDGLKIVTLVDEHGRQHSLAADELLIAGGRRPLVDGLNPEAAGIALVDGQIATDEALRTSVPHIWAAGDVTSDYPFTHVAWRQGAHVAGNILKGTARPFAPGPIPWVTYTDPELAHVGRTAAELDEAGIAYQELCQPVSKVARAIVTGQTEGRVKLLVGEDGRILGGQVLAENGGELIGPVVLAMQAGLPVSALANSVWPYPTMSTALGAAARQRKE